MTHQNYKNHSILTAFALIIPLFLLTTSSTIVSSQRAIEPVLKFGSRTPQKNTPEKPAVPTDELTARDPCTGRWDKGLTLDVSTIGTVSVLAADGAGGIYAGGGFYAVGETPANSIARWNGTSWTALGSGPAGGGGVRSIAVAGNDVYVAGDPGSPYVSKWDGSSWTQLGPAFDFELRTVAVSRGEIYAGGGKVDYDCNNDQDYCYETAAYGYVVRWNGSSWTPVGQPMNRYVNALAVSGSDVYAGGEFTTAGGTSVDGIAKWNGTSWVALGGGAGGPVNTMTIVGGDLYAGGRTTPSNSPWGGYVSKWSGTAWSSIGSAFNGSVQTVVVTGSAIHAAGSFTSVDGIEARHVAKWNGTSWGSVGFLNSQDGVPALAVSGNQVYAGGFRTVEESLYNIAKWDGSNWTELVKPRVRGNGVNGFVQSIAVSGTDVYAGGNFTRAGEVASHIARWNGTKWLPLGSGINGSNASTHVFALAVSGSDVYAGGLFTNAGGLPVNNIAKWDGSAWSQLGSGLNGTVYSLAVSGTDLYAAGNFTMAGGTPAYNLARWNGSNWSALGSGIPNQYGYSVGSVAFMGADVLAGGSFGIPLGGGNYANSLAKWNGSSWSGFTNGISLGWVTDLAVSGTDLYVLTFSGIAKWTGSNWSYIVYHPGNNNRHDINRIFASGTDLFASGSFTSIAGVPANKIAKWNGSSWAPLDDPPVGDYATVGKMAVSGNYLYVAVSGKAGCRELRGFGRYSLLETPDVSISGRVLTPGGLGLRNASVTLTDMEGNKRTVLTSTLGFYSFDKIQAGETVTIAAVSRRYRLESVTRTANDNLTDVDLVGLE